MCYHAHKSSGNGHYIVTGWGRIISRHDDKQAAIRRVEQLNRAMGLTSDGHESERLERQQAVESDAAEWARWRSE